MISEWKNPEERLISDEQSDLDIVLKDYTVKVVVRGFS